MSKRKKIIAAICIAAIVAAAAIALFAFAAERDKAIAAEQDEFKSGCITFGVLQDVEFPKQNLEGYSDLSSWFAALKEAKAEGIGLEESILAEVEDYMSVEQVAFVKEYCYIILNAGTIEEINSAKHWLAKVYEAGLEEKSAAEAITESAVINTGGGTFYDTMAQSGVLTKSGGVNQYNGYRETYYSSNVLYHYMTPEWNLGSDGVWRDAEGYVIVASSDLGYGSTVDTSLGEGKVYDSGCASGTNDIYVAW